MRTPWAPRRARRMQSRARGSSSTMSTRTADGTAGASMTLGTNGDIALHDGGVVGNEETCAHASARDVRDVDRRRVRPVQLRQPRARVRETDALARRAAVGGMEP